MSKKSYKIKNVIFDKYFVIYDNELVEDMGRYSVKRSMEQLIRQKFLENIIDIELEEIE